MKKIIFFMFLFFVSNSYVYSQWYIIPEAGMSTIKRNNLGDSWNAGIKTGLGVEYKFNTATSLKTGLYYARRGYSLGTLFDNNNYPEVTSISKINRNFVQLPVLFNYSCPLSNDVSFNVAAGPYVGISLKDSWEGGYIDDNKESIFQDLKSFDWGLSALIGIEINKKWIVNIGYDLSLGKEIKEDDIKANYHTINLSIGYKFSLKK